MRPVDAVEKLTEFIKDDRTRFLNQTRLVSSFALALAERYNLGGRDSLIIGCYLYYGVSRIFTHDEEILKLERWISKEGESSRTRCRGVLGFTRRLEPQLGLSTLCLQESKSL
jgi:hypothetical protein